MFLEHLRESEPYKSLKVKHRSLIFKCGFYFTDINVNSADWWNKTSKTLSVEHALHVIIAFMRSCATFPVKVNFSPRPGFGTIFLHSAGQTTRTTFNLATI